MIVAMTFVQLLDEVLKLPLVLNETAYLVRAPLYGLLQLKVLLEDHFLALLALDHLLASVLELEHARVNGLCGRWRALRAPQILLELLDLGGLPLHRFVIVLQPLLLLFNYFLLPLGGFKLTSLTHHSLLELLELGAPRLKLFLFVVELRVQALHLVGIPLLLGFNVCLGTLSFSQLLIDHLEVLGGLLASRFDRPKFGLELRVLHPGGV